MIKEVDYDCDEQCFCLIWVLSEVFQEGNYEVEIYNKGYFVGMSSFQLRQCIDKRQSKLCSSVWVFIWVLFLIGGM